MENSSDVIQFLINVYKYYINEIIFYQGYIDFDAYYLKKCNIVYGEWVIDRTLSISNENNCLVIIKKINNDGLNTNYYLIDFESYNLIKPEESKINKIY